MDFVPSVLCVYNDSRKYMWELIRLHFFSQKKGFFKSDQSQKKGLYFSTEMYHRKKELVRGIV